MIHPQIVIGSSKNLTVVGQSIFIVQIDLFYLQIEPLLQKTHSLQKFRYQTELFVFL
jgi:hypothetical protein